MQRGFSTIIIIICGLIAITIAIIILYVSQKTTAQPSLNNPSNIESLYTTTPTIASSPDPTINWKAYESPAFSFKYPNNLYAKTSSKYPNVVFITQNDINIDLANEGPFYIISIETKPNHDLIQEIKTNTQNFHTPSDTLVDKYSAKKLSGNFPQDDMLYGSFNEKVFTKKDSTVYEFNFIQDQNDNTKLLDQILNTFEFTD